MPCTNRPRHCRAYIKSTVHVHYANTFWSRVSQCDRHRAAHISIHVFLAPVWMIRITCTEANSILSCTSQCYMLWLPSEGDRKSMILLLLQGKMHHTCNTFRQGEKPGKKKGWEGKERRWEMKRESSALRLWSGYYFLFPESPRLRPYSLISFSALNHSSFWCIVGPRSKNGMKRKDTRAQTCWS